MHIVERLFGRTKHDTINEMVLLFEKRVKPRIDSEISGFDADKREIAEGVVDLVEREMLAMIVTETLAPTKEPKDARPKTVLIKVRGE